MELAPPARAVAAGSTVGEPADLRTIAAAALTEAVDLVVVGPEAPLAAGLVDVLEDAGIAAFGPRREAARLEASKLHAKEVMADAGVPTAAHTVLRDHGRGDRGPRRMLVPGRAQGGRPRRAARA